MPDNTLKESVEGTLRGANDYLRANKPDPRRRDINLSNLRTAAARLEADIDERKTTYSDELDKNQDHEVNARWAELSADRRFARINTEQQARQQTFEHLRQVNGGAYPTNLSPVLYMIPLIMIGVAEWYVNYSTFASIFVPFIAIAGTILVGAIFAWASHLHGSYVKQLSEILHPSVEYRNILGRKIATAIATVLFIIAFLTVVWLRYVVISDQLGVGSSTGSATFGGASTSMIWSRLAPTIVLNLLIWGLGTLYAWATNEKVPGLRDAYRQLQRSNKLLEKARRPLVAEQKRIEAQFNRERQNNQVAVTEYSNLLANVNSMIQRLET